MADARKTLKKIGGRKKSSSRRNSSCRKRKGDMPEWLHTLIATLTTAALLFVAYHLVFKDALFRFAEEEEATSGEPSALYGYSVFGIDISRYQGDIDWKELKEKNPDSTPIHFVYMKASEGKEMKDPYFDKNWKEAKEAGFIRGAYHYFTTGSGGAEQAAQFIRNVTLEKGDLPPMVDVEEVPTDKEAFNRELKHFILALETRYGVKPIIYASPDFRKNYLDDSIYESYPTWVAHYHVEKPDIGYWDIWQFTDEGELPGIGHRVDLNIFNGGVPELKKMTLKK